MEIAAIAATAKSVTQETKLYIAQKDLRLSAHGAPRCGEHGNNFVGWIPATSEELYKFHPR